MGWLKKITRPISKVLDKIIPNEIKPALPYLSAFAPFMMGPTSGIMGSSMLRRGLMSGALNLGSQLAQEGSEGEFNPLSLLLASGTGAMTSPDAPGFFQGMQKSGIPGGDPNMITGADAGFYVGDGMNIPVAPDKTGIMASVKDAIGKGGETASKFLIEQGDILRPGGKELTMKNALTAGSVPITQGTADLAMISAQQALDEYNAGLEEGSDAWYDDDARRVAIRSAMEAAGHVEDDILDALASLGLKQGGIVGLRNGGRIGFDNGGVSSIFGNPDRSEYEEFMKNIYKNVRAFENDLEKRLMNEYDLDRNTARRYAGIINFYVNSNPRMLSGKEEILEEGYLGNNEIILKEIKNKNNINSFAIEKSKGGRIGFDNGGDVKNKSDDMKINFEDYMDPRNLTTEDLILLIRNNRGTPEIFKELMLRDVEGIESLMLDEIGGKKLDKPQEVFQVNEEELKDYRVNQRSPIESFLYDLRENNPDIYGEYREPERFMPMADPDNKAKGGRINKEGGGMTSVLPRGAEMDYRGGGMIPMGSKERADDVPARLSKNEFVMTADAVRAAGGGSVNRGAKRMYDLMHNLEARV